MLRDFIPRVLLTRHRRHALPPISPPSDEKVWHATPPDPDTTACVAFGRDACAVDLRFFRLQNPGSLAGYDPLRTKAWDSHLAAAENVLGEKRARSTLVVDSRGVTIAGPDGVATWRIDAPATGAPTAVSEREAFD